MWNLRSTKVRQDLKIAVSVAVTPCVLNAWEKVLDLGEEDPVRARRQLLFLELVGLGVLVDVFNAAHLIIAQVFLFESTGLCFLC